MDNSPQIREWIIEALQSNPDGMEYWELKERISQHKGSPSQRDLALNGLKQFLQNLANSRVIRIKHSPAYAGASKYWIESRSTNHCVSDD